MGTLDKTLAKAGSAKKKPARKRYTGKVVHSDDPKGKTADLRDTFEQVKELDGSVVDIRLDQDLSNFELPSSKSLYQNNNLDIDLTGPMGIEDDFIESQILEIDPLKSFSGQVEINLGKLRRNGYIALDNANTALSQNFRAIKRPLLNNVMGKGATVIDNANLIMVTSSLAGEGKTFSAINLALSMAMEKDKKILLIDADVSKPSHHEIFGIEMQKGLIDHLSGRVQDVSRIINKTNVPSLSVIFAGGRSIHSVELLASQAMTSFVEELSSRYEDRVIIFDSAPLLLPTEASVLASHMGQVVIVVEAEYTAQKLVQQSIDMLDNRIVLLVLNKVRGNDKFGSYGYGHDET